MGVLGERKNIAIIPAKLKSQRCKDKNWKEFKDGESLAEIMFNRIIGSGYFNTTILSIDFDPKKVAFLKKPRDIAMRIGLVVRRRPRLLGKSSVDVAIDALEYVNASPLDIYALIQPTSPFLSPDTMLKAIRHVRSSNDRLVGVTPAYKPSGGIYAGVVKDLYRYRDFYRPFVTPLVLDWMECIDIDYDYDFEIARSLFV